MRTALLVLLPLALGSCANGRIQQLRTDISSLQKSVDALNADVKYMRDVLQRQPPPTAAIRIDNDPEGFDLSRPLPEGHARLPDVILLSVDTLRADHLGAYGYERDTSPFIDALADEGTLFASAWSPTSWTLPSHTTMLSGMLPEHHGTIDDHLRIPSDVAMVQEAFQRAGYQTGGATATLFVSRKFGFDRGFDFFEDFGILGKKENNASTVDADHVFHTALHWAQERDPGVPLFLFLHVYDVHYGYDAPPPWNEKFDRAPRWGDAKYKNYHAYKKRMINGVQLEHQVAQYDEEIAFVDDSFRELVEKWQSERGNVLVSVTADHGEEFGERGSWGHGHTLYPEQLHVPWVIAGPGVPAQVLDQRVGTEDIAVTLATLAGVPFRAPDAVDRAMQVRRGGEARPEHVSAPFAASSRFDTLVYRWHAPPYDLYLDLVAASRALCNVEEDPTCASNLFKGNRDLADDMFRDMLGWLGAPWQAKKSGVVNLKGGVVFQDGQRKKQPHRVSPGDRFHAEPGDAKVRFTSDDDQVTHGPWRALGGEIPTASDPVRFSGRHHNEAAAEMTADEQAMLRELGYLQGDDEGN